MLDLLNDHPDSLTAREFSGMLGVKPSTIYRQVDHGPATSVRQAARDLAAAHLASHGPLDESTCARVWATLRPVKVTSA
jgi:DNA-binding IclR family transcriptional regulator